MYYLVFGINCKKKTTQNMRENPIYKIWLFTYRMNEPILDF